MQAQLAKAAHFDEIHVLTGVITIVISIVIVGIEASHQHDHLGSSSNMVLGTDVGYVTPV